MNVGSVSLEVGMCLDLHLYHQITCWASQALVSLLGDAQVNPVVHALGHVDRLFDLLGGDAATSAGGAWIPDNTSLAVAVAAHLLNHKRPLANSLETGAAASPTCRLPSARLGLGALASAAEVRAIEGNSFLSAIDSVHEVNLHR